MADGTGLQGHIGLAFQSAVGTVQTGSIHWLPFVSETIQEDIAVLESAAIRARFDEPTSKQGFRTVAGDVVLQADPASLAPLLHAVLGVTNTTAADTNTTNIHSFTMISSSFAAGAPMQPFTLFIDRDVGSEFQYMDLFANQLTLNYAHGELVGATLGVLGGGFDQRALNVPVFVSENSSSLIPWNVVSAQIASTAVTDLISAELQILNNLETRGTLVNTYHPIRVKRSNFRQVRINGTFEFENLTQFAIWQAGTQQELILNAANNATNFLKITAHKFKYDTYTDPMGGPGAITADFAGRAEYDDTNAETAAFLLKTSSFAFNTIGNGTIV
jgi:hypothetical protein